MAQKGRVPGSGKNYKYGKPMLNERLPKGKNAIAKVMGAEGPKKSSSRKPAVTAKKVGAKKVANMTKKGRLDLPKRGR
jgi:hypothetical protein